MTAYSDSTPEVIRCRTTADFLAALPLLVGFTATNSIFIVLFAGRFAGRTVRLDLPEDDSPATTAPLLDFIAGTLRELHEIETISPAIVITTDLPFPPRGPAPWQRLARRLERRLRRDGLPLRELCCLAADRWVGFLDPHAPAGGRPLSEIERSTVARLHRSDAEVHDLSTLGRIPAPDPARSEAVSQALSQLPPYTIPRPVPGRSFGEAARSSRSLPRDGLDWMHETAAVAEALRAVSATPSSGLDPTSTARLARTAAHSDRWLVLVIGLLTRPEFPIELAQCGEAPEGFAGIPIDVDDGSRRPPVAGWSIRRILTGICPGFEDHERLPPLVDALARSIADTPTELRPGQFALSALLWWLRGNQTVASRHIAEALAITADDDDDDAIVRMVERVVEVPLTARMLRSRQRQSAGRAA
ncbi:hypothetical protein [Leucobacter sp. gxy201]|uniref:hypothetical protein n=1 Tax=Leucobacter sp. gxy201 TaxID=2957200 RepID=UPI003D9FEDA0